jgi:hypothetical protein
MVKAIRITSLYGVDPYDPPITESKSFETASTIEELGQKLTGIYSSMYRQHFQWDLILRDDYRIIHVIGTESTFINPASKTGSGCHLKISDYFLIIGEKDIYSDTNACAEEIAEKEEQEYMETCIREAQQKEKALDDIARSWAEWWIDKHTPWIGELMLKGSLQNLLTEVIINVYKRLKDVD